MSPVVLDQAVDFMAGIVAETNQRRAKVTLHGGEPLVAGHSLLQRAMQAMLDRLGPGRTQWAIQSNLWLLDDAWCDLFGRHRVEVGTSLDGPQAITDLQRGAGYFARTMAGIRLARRHGLSVGCIATFTPASLPRWREVFDFFLASRLGFSIHPALPPLGGPATHALSASQYGELLRQMLDYYIDHRRELSVSSLDQLCQAFGAGEGKVCTFRDCLGMFLAIDANGDIFPCQRFAGRPQWRLGTLAERPTTGQLFASSVARRFAARQEAVRQDCGDCAHLGKCLGGCPYNAWAAGEGQVRDGFCQAYREVMDYIQQRLVAEMASPENIEAVAARPWDGRGNPLLKKGPLIELVRPSPPPAEVARTARGVVAAVELAKAPDAPTAAEALVRMGVYASAQEASAHLVALQQRLHPPQISLNNLYVHLTFACQLRCTHCYAQAEADGGAMMAVVDVERLVREARACGFRQVVLTGGEPLIHRDRAHLLEMLADVRRQVVPMNLVLRSNLAMPLDGDSLRAIAAAADQLVVSVDGNEATHDARRGRGSYAATVANLEAYARLLSERQPNGRPALSAPAELSLACVMRAAEIQGPPGRAVHELATRLGVRRTRFRPLLPLGRASDWNEPPTSEALGAHADPMELIEGGFGPIASCGLGQNLYVEPSGESFPCYAMHHAGVRIGNVLAQGLAGVLERPAFRSLSDHHVDTNPKCRQCEVRYLCGGACRAWNHRQAAPSLDAEPLDCAGLRGRAEALLAAAVDYLRRDVACGISLLEEN
jgi:uncharacterized protein